MDHYKNRQFSILTRPSAYLLHNFVDITNYIPAAPQTTRLHNCILFTK